MKMIWKCKFHFHFVKGTKKKRTFPLHFHITATSGENIMALQYKFFSSIVTVWHIQNSLIPNENDVIKVQHYKQTIILSVSKKRVFHSPELFFLFFILLYQGRNIPF